MALNTMPVASSHALSHFLQQFLVLLDRHCWKREKLSRQIFQEAGIGGEGYSGSRRRWKWGIWNVEEMVKRELKNGQRPVLRGQSHRGKKWSRLERLEEAVVRDALKKSW